MRLTSRTLMLMIICGWLANGLAAELNGGRNVTTTQSTLPKSNVFNVLDYGAKGDDKTDNTNAFSASLAAVIEAGGGRMVIPAGVYRGRIIIPPFQASSWIVVEIVGAGQPAPVFGTIGSFPLLDNGTIIKSPDTSGPAVISATPDPNSPYGNFSMFCIVVRNLEVRTSDNPAINGIDLTYVPQCIIENVVVNTGVYSVQASQSTHDTAGIVTPAGTFGPGGSAGLWMRQKYSG